MALTMGNYKEIFAKNVLAILEERQKNQAWLAKRSGVKLPNLGKLLKAEGNPTLETLTALADALGVSVDDLLAGSPVNKTHFWSDEKQIQEELDILHIKLNKIAALIAESMDGEELEGLFHTKSVIEDRIWDLNGRLGFIRGQRKGQPSNEHRLAKIKNKLLAMTNDQFQHVEDSINQILNPIDLDAEISTTSRKTK